MDTFQIWSLIFASITALSVLLNLIFSTYKFIKCKLQKVVVNYSIVEIIHYQNDILITLSLDLINQTELPTSIFSIEILFNNKNVIGTHTVPIIKNVLTDVDTKNIYIKANESVSMPYINFKCPSSIFNEHALLKIKTVKRDYKYPISFQTHGEFAE